MGGGVDQRAVVVLAVNFDQSGAEIFAAPVPTPADR